MLISLMKMPNFKEFGIFFVVLPPKYKKYTMKSYLFLFSLLFSGSLLAQGGQSPSANLNGGAANSSLRDAFNAVNYNGFHVANGSGPKISGTPFAFDNATMVINTIDGKSFKVPNGNYNAKTNQIVSNFAKDSSFVFDTNFIETVKINNHVAKQYRIEGKGRRFFFDLTPHSSIKLLKEYKASIKAGQINVMTKLKTSPDKYIMRDKLAISRDGINVEFMKLKKKTILKLLSDKSELIEQFVDDNDLSYKDEADLIKIFNYYSIN